MIDSPIFFAGMTYLPATLGFMGCIKPKIVFPIAILTILGKSDKNNVITGLYIYLKLLVTINLLPKVEGMCIGQK